MTTYPAFVLTQSANDKKYYWILKASNGRTILRSVIGFKTKQNAQKNIAAVLKYGTNPNKYDYDTANIAGNGFYFWLAGFKRFKPNGELSKIAMSGNGKFYRSVSWHNAEQGLKKGIKACVSQLKLVNNKKVKIIDKTRDKRRKPKF